MNLNLKFHAIRNSEVVRAMNNRAGLEYEYRHEADVEIVENPTYAAPAPEAAWGGHGSYQAMMDAVTGTTIEQREANRKDGHDFDGDGWRQGAV